MTWGIFHSVPPAMVVTFIFVPFFAPASWFLSVAGLLTMVAVYQLQIIGFPLLAGYGILRAQLFDIDLKIKWTINRTTVAAALVAVFLVTTEGAQVIFGERNPWLGIAAAAVLVFALAPLQRLADRISDVAMPRVLDNPAYLQRRKEEICRAACESARLDGRVSEKERDVLATLAQELDLGPAHAHAIEREAAT